MDQFSPVVLSLGSVLVVSTISLIGVLFFAANEKVVRKMLLYFVSFSTGGLLGDVFIHMIPEMVEEGELVEQGMYVVLGGIVFSFVVEKLIHWRHCHFLPVREHAGKHEHDHCHPVGVISLIADGVHNFIDGVLIAGSFLISVPVGLSTTLAVIFHEIPQEIGDFAILLHSGYKKSRAILFNLLSALGAVVGVILVLVAESQVENISAYLLPFAAGNFLYIAGADLIPELHKETRIRQAFVQLLAMIAGIGVMYALTALE